MSELPELPEAHGDPSDVPEPPMPPPFLGRRLRLGQAAFVGVYADGLLAVLSLAFIPYLIRRLGTEPYGILGIVSVLGGQLATFHFGVGTAGTRLVADSVGRGGEGLRERLTGIGLVGAAASLLVGAIFLLVAPIAWRGGFDVSAAALPIALAAVPAGAAVIALTPASAAVFGVLTARERFLFAAALRVYQGAGRLLAAVAAVALGGGVVGVLWAQAAVDLSSVLLGWVRCWGGIGARRARPGDAGGDGGMLEALTMVLAVGAPFTLVSLLSGLLTDAEKLAVGLALSVDDFTFYTVPFNAVIKFTVLSGAVVRVLTPRVTMLCARGEYQEALRITERADRILAIGTFGVLAPVIALAPELLRLWVGDTFALQSTLATRLLVVGVGVNALAFPAFSVVLGRGRPAHLTMLYGAEVVIHLATVYTLVSLFGIPGAAAAWTIRVVIDTLAQRTLAERTLGLRLGDGAYVWGALGMLAVFVAVAPLLPLVARVAVGGAVALGCAFRLGRGRDAVMLIDSFLPSRWGKEEA